MLGRYENEVSSTSLRFGRNEKKDGWA